MLAIKGLNSGAALKMIPLVEYHLKAADVKNCANVTEFNELLNRVFRNKIPTNNLLNAATVSAKDANGFSFRYGHHGTNGGTDLMGPILFTIGEIKIPKIMEFVLSIPRQVNMWWGKFHILAETQSGKSRLLYWTDTMENTTTAGTMYTNADKLRLFTAATFIEKVITLDTAILTNCFKPTDQTVKLHFCMPKTLRRTDVAANINIYPMVINGMHFTY